MSRSTRILFCFAGIGLASALVFQNCSPNFKVSKDAQNMVISASITMASLMTTSTSKRVSPDKIQQVSWSLASGQKYVFEPNNFACVFDGQSYNPCASPVQLTDLTDGHHIFEITAKNDDIVVASGAYDFYVDTTAPDLTINTFPGDISGSSTLSASFSASDAVSGVDHFNCLVDGVSALCTSPFTQSGLSDGPHTFAVEAVDAVGNTSNRQTRRWIVSTSAPAIVTTSAPAFTLSAATIAFTVTSKAGLAVQSTCALDGGTANPCAASFSADSLTEGSHSLTITSTDQTGAHSNLVVNWIVDLTAPSITLLNQQNVITSASPYTLQFSAVDKGSGLGSCECATGSGGFSSCSNSYAVAYAVDGPQTASVRCRDALGNLSPTQTLNWIWDRTPPALSINTTTAQVTANTSSTFNLTVSDTFTASPRLEVSVNGGAFKPLSGPSYTLQSTDGMQSILFRATDDASNATVRGFNWTVDALPPTDPTTIQLVASNIVQYSATWSSTDTTGVDHYEVKIGTSALGDDIVKTVSVQSPTYSFIDGNYNAPSYVYVSVRAFDKFGHVSNWSTSAPFKLSVIAGSLGCASSDCTSSAVMDTSRATLQAGTFKTTYVLTPTLASTLSVADFPGPNSSLTTEATAFQVAFTATCSVGGLSWDCDPQKITLPANLPLKTLAMLNVVLKFGSQAYTTLSRQILPLPTVNLTPDSSLKPSPSMLFARNANMAGTVSLTDLSTDLYVKPNLSVISSAEVGSACSTCSSRIVVGDGSSLSVPRIDFFGNSAYPAPTLSVGRNAVFMSGVARIGTINAAEGSLIILSSLISTPKVMLLDAGVPGDPCVLGPNAQCPSNTVTIQ